MSIQAYTLQTVIATARRFEEAPPEQVLAWALEEFHPSIALASSFGAEDMVLIDILFRLCAAPRIFTLDTGRLPQETSPLFFEDAFFCRRCQGMATSKTCPHDGRYRVSPNGTGVRALLKAGQLLPPEIIRPEVATVLGEILAMGDARSTRAPQEGENS